MEKVTLLPRILGALALLAIAMFFVFCFLASFESGNGLLWKLGYGALGCCCLAIAMRLLSWRSKAGKSIIAAVGMFILAVLLFWLGLLLWAAHH
jgi:hypothetical protein